MSSSLDWTDAVGSASLTNGKIIPGDRFANWQPRSVPFTAGDETNDLGKGDLYIFEYREDHSASFEIVGIPYSSLDLMLRLQNHLEGGGTCQVTTGDRDANVYPECCLAPDSSIEIQFTDNVTMEFTVSMTLLNLDAAQMLCRY